MASIIKVEFFDIICGGAAASKMIEEGRYQFVDCALRGEVISPDVLFSIFRHRPTQVKLAVVVFDQQLSYKEVLVEFEKRRWKAPRFEDGFCFGIQYPQAALDYGKIIFPHEPVFVFGKARSKASILALVGIAGEREITLVPCGDKFKKTCAFAAVVSVRSL